MSEKKSFWSQLWDWLKNLFTKVQDKSLEDIVDYIKKKFGEAEVVADEKSFASWVDYIIALIQDLYTLLSSETTTEIDTKSDTVGSEAKLKTNVAKDLKNKLKK